MDLEPVRAKHVGATGEEGKDGLGEIPPETHRSLVEPVMQKIMQTVEKVPFIVIQSEVPLLQARSLRLVLGLGEL